MLKTWNLQHSSYPYDYSIFKIREDVSLRPWDQQEQSFVVLECPDWVNIIPVTREGKILLVRQFRQGSKTITLEIPGGMIDSSDSSPESAAKRELEEETGAVSSRWIFLGNCVPNPAFQDNECYHYLALDVEQIKPIQPDPNESFETVSVSLEELDQLVASGEISHSLVLAAFYAWERWQRKNGQTVICP